MTISTFKYKAISTDGAPVNGVVDAYDEFEAVEKIKATCSVVTHIAEASDKPGLLQRDITPPKVKEKALALLCSQFAIILTAGLPVVRAVRLIEAQTTDKVLKKLLNKVAEDVASGYSLAESFENKGAKLLPPTFVQTVRAGEESGTLEKSFARLQIYYEKSSKVRAKVKSAMTYPIFLIVLALVVVAFIMAVVMPTFIDMFEQLDAELPGLTVMLVGFTNFMASYWPLVIAVVAALIISIKLWSKTENGRLRMAKLQLKLPALGRVNRMKGAGQLANTLSILLSAGMPLIKAVQSTSHVLDNYHMQLRLGASVSRLEEGRPLGESIQECGCFPDMLVEMAAMGEETGALEETLQTIGAYYDNEVEVASARALSMLQPAITVVVGILIGIIVIGLYLPMFSMYGSM